MKCPGLHCPGCGDGGGLALLLIAAAAAAAYAVASWVILWWWLVLGVITACVVMTGAAVVALMRWSDRRAARPVHQLAAGVRPHLEASGRPAIGPAREVHLHLNVTPDQLAAIVRHHTEEDR